MKKKILGTVLLSTVVLSNLGVAAIATETTVAPTNGTVTVEQGEIEEPTPPEKPTEEPGDPGDSKNPEKPTEPVIPDIPGTHNPDGDPDNPGFTPGEPLDPTNPGTGAIKLLGASNLRFGVIKSGASKIVKNAAAAKVFTGTVDPVTEELTGPYTEKAVGNYVQFGDVRTNKNGFTLSAELTNQFATSDGTEIKNASIVYTNAVLTHADGAAPVNSDIALNPNKLELTEDGGSVNFVTLAAEDSTTAKGKGIFSLEFGQTSEYGDEYTVQGVAAKGTEANSVFLNIPAASAANLKVADYTADITWTLTEGQP